MARETALDIFAKVGSVYQERNQASGGISAQEYSQGAEVGKATNTGSSQTVQPSSSDFICDVEIAARRCLNSGELAYFNLFYKSGAVVILVQDQFDPGNVDICLEGHIHNFSDSQQAAVRSLDRRMRVKLGEQFYLVELHPTCEYMAARDVRCPRRPKIRWSHLY